MHRVHHPSFGLLVVLHRTEDVALGILEEHERADSDDHRSIEDNLAATTDDCGLDLVERGHADRALESEGSLALDQRAAALERAVHPGAADLIEAWRPARAALPAEHLL